MTSPPAPPPSGLPPNFRQVQAHYDLSDEFYRLFLDSSLTYSCAYFAEPTMTLEEAQIAKIDLALDKLGLTPGMTLLDVGCGWGSTLMRAEEKYDVNVIGLTLSKNQHTHIERLFADTPSTRSRRVLLQGWERFTEPVDRIVSIGAFEHFGFERYDNFFQFAHRALPDNGVMLLHTITALHPRQVSARGLRLTFELARFIKFILTEIFPGGRLPSQEMVESHAVANGFTIDRVQSLRPHYVKTLDAWATRLCRHRTEAIAVQSDEVYLRYIKYLNGCTQLFRDGYTDVYQFTLRKTDHVITGG
ncbi:cyclopropane mycolic acid synthase family methyltransferase [Mycobacterium sp. 1465703.0]|uniref:cyclopropane mycolic acid synthase family methyltransferase n=1 Tax=Mycobacterium sp. 1465703.0 TaxID=1834078 RepID=UPI001E57A572|nr:cyclopropane mycolic acid synthase family methyltransferase [Mycobacterium sp. 1465703.0]